MITLRKANERGPSNLGWLDSKHTFSFGSYQDENHMGYASLRVINDDHVNPGTGFKTHPHENMEIVSYVLSGALEHKDSMGNGSIIRQGEVQLMSAGTGVTHSENNHSKDEEVHFLQIWFLPKELDITPRYEQKYFDDNDKRGTFRLVVSASGRDGSLSINQDIDMSIALLDNEERISYTIPQHRKAWVHIARGQLTMNGMALETGDGVAIDSEDQLTFSEGKNAEVLIFDMAPHPKTS